jgi:transcription initiation factor TFIIIB Brf1 subunit/transcription initiation factor TFIIB
MTSFIQSHQHHQSISNILIEEIFKQAEETQTPFKETMYVKTYSCLCEGAPDVQDIRGDILCIACGLVLERQNISDENESTVYGTGEEGGNNGGQSRCSGIVDSLMGKSNLSTGISGEGRMQNLLKWQTFDYSEIVMMQTKKTFTEAAQTLKAPSKVINQSCHYYKEVFQHKIDGKKFVVRGNNKNGVLAVCFHTALVNSNESIQLQEIIKYFQIDNTTFNKSCKLLQQHLKKYFKNTTEDSSNECLTRLCNKAGLPYKLQSICKRVFFACESLRVFPEISKNILNSICIFFVITEVKCDISIDTISIHSKISKETILKKSKILTENKIKIFNFIKQQ